MPSRAAAELRELTDDQLVERAESAKEELFNLRFQLATGQVDKPSAIKKARARRGRGAGGEPAQRGVEPQGPARAEVRAGVVISDGMDKTVVVRIDRSFRHPL